MESGVVVLLEIEDGALHLTSKSRSMAKQGTSLDLEPYLAAQRRFSGLDETAIREMQHATNERWQACAQRDNTLA